MIPRPDCGGSPSRRGTSYQQMSRCAPSSVAVIVESVRIFELRPSAPTTRSACSRCRAPPRVYSTPTTRPPPSRSSADARAPISTRNPGKRAGLLHHERQEPALRDQRVVRVLRARAPVVGQAVGAGGGAPHECVRGAVRHGGEQRIGEPQSVEHLEHGRGEGVATEPAVEVGPGLEQRDRHARPGQQVGQHHPARASADDRAAGGALRRHGPTLTARRTLRRVGAPAQQVRQPCTVCDSLHGMCCSPARCVLQPCTACDAPASSLRYRRAVRLAPLLVTALLAAGCTTVVAGTPSAPTGVLLPPRPGRSAWTGWTRARS